MGPTEFEASVEFTLIKKNLETPSTLTALLRVGERRISGLDAVGFPSTTNRQPLFSSCLYSGSGSAVTSNCTAELI